MVDTEYDMWAYSVYSNVWRIGGQYVELPLGVVPFPHELREGCFEPDGHKRAVTISK